ncbi:MAG: tRNA glutamyl-Q(34) synthetase GluQRS [Psychromonas sp.]|nr:tRNA glutamyl-Q(34) synthetase GluQRS [Psychromonas sp.]
MGNKKLKYIGRFAPSPSGPLHFGSLVTAVASYLQAKSKNGLWHVRIEDIDPPREFNGAAEDILNTLLTYQLQWDGELVYQSQQTKRYQRILNYLQENDFSYYCQCTRKIIKQQGGFYLGGCKNKHLLKNNNAQRINLSRLDIAIDHFHDQLHGRINTPINDDFIIKRKDGLYAYNLAVVLDDINQNITEIVRGADLIETTTKQLSLYKILDKPAPTYLHLPLVITASGKKLSKQNKAQAISKINAPETLCRALTFLGQNPPQSLSSKSCLKILHWAVIHWNLNKIPKKNEIQS